MAVSQRVPGQYSGTEFSNRNPLWSQNGLRVVGGTIDAANSYDGAHTNFEQAFRPGTILARITASKLWVPCKRTQANGAGSSATALIVDDARAFIAGETLQIGSTTGVISSVNYSTNTITLTAAKTWSDNDVVYTITLKDGSTSAAGAEIGRAILDEHIDCVDRLPGVATAAKNSGFGRGLVAGGVDQAQCLGDIAAIRAATNKLGFIQFADDAGIS